MNYKFTNNLLIGAHKREEVDFADSGLTDDIACY